MEVASMLIPGDPAPHFRVPSSINPNYSFDMAAGRYIVLSFFGSSQIPYSAGLLSEVARRRERFDGFHAVFFGVSIDAQDQGRLKQEWPGIMYFWDFDQAVSRLYGVIGDAGASSGGAAEAGGPGRVKYEARTFVLDPSLRVVAVIDFAQEPAAHVDFALRVIDSLPAVEAVELPTPVLMVPYVFEPELCRELIGYYQSHGGQESGFMRDVNGKTVAMMDHSHKRRQDCKIDDADLVARTGERLMRRVAPAIRQAFQFQVSRIERYIVACYDAADAGHFRAHRDNATLATAHRRFAVSINLNSEEFEGGQLRFPEFGARWYKPPTGGGVVFSCSLLHEATTVTKRQRYAFLPFLHDDAAEQVRERNHQYLATTPAARNG